MNVPQTLRSIRRAYIGNSIAFDLINMIFVITTSILSISIFIDIFWPEAVIRAYTGLQDERSLPNIFSQGLSAICAFMLYVAFRRHGLRVFLAFCILYLFVWFDDSMQYHERGGRILDRSGITKSLFGLRARDIGEILSWVAASIPIGLIFIWSLRKMVPGEIKIYYTLGFIFFTLFVFGTVFDMVHILVSDRFQMMLGWIEDGGEILAVAMATAAAVLFSFSNNAVLLNASPLLREDHDRMDRADPA